MKESILGVDKNLVMKGTFISEDAVRKSGGIPVNSLFTDGSFKNNTTAVGNGITYSVPLNGTYSIIMSVRVAAQSANNRYLFGSSGPTYYLRMANTFAGGTAFEVSSGTRYIEGVANSAAAPYFGTNKFFQVAVTGITLNTNAWMLNNHFANAGATFTDIEIESVEIYKGTLTANEILNIYSQRQNREVIKMGTDRGTNIPVTFVNGTTLPMDNFVATSTGFTASGTVTSNYEGCASSSIGTVGAYERVIVEFDIVKSGTSTVSLYLSDAQTGANGTGTPVTNLTTGHYIATLINGNISATRYLQFNTSNSAGQTYDIAVSNLKVYYPATYAPEILRVDARNGVINNKYSGSVTGTELGSVLTLWSKSGTVTDSGNAVQFVPAQTNYVYKSIGSVNKRYLIAIKASSTANGDTIRVYQGATAGATAVTLTTSPITYTAIITDTSSPTMYIQGLTGSGTVTVELISIQEIIPAVTPTAVSIVRSGNVYAMDFNGTTSNVDCGSYNTLVGNKTLVMWFNMTEPNPLGSEQDLITNGKFRFFYNNLSSSAAYFASDGSTLLGGSTPNVRNRWYLLTVTRTSTGITNVYYNGAPIFTANYSTGTPAAGTSNIILGGVSKRFKGLLSNVRIYDGILSTAEIAQIYQDEKALYNL